MIPFNIPCVTGNEMRHVRAAIGSGHISGNGPYGQKVTELLRRAYGFQRVLLTHSCTGALELAALCCAFHPGDEVILPSFTHVGTANAFERAGATLVFADSSVGHPNVDPASIAARIGPRTRALVVVHYAGMGCDMRAIRRLADAHGLLLIEDAAHGLGASYEGEWLGSFGDFAAFSFHETKNITCGQGGMLVVNNKRFAERAAIHWENGTNRAAFFRGEVNQYTWVDRGGCYTLGDMAAAYLFAQLQEREAILDQRVRLWSRYHQALRPLAVAGKVELPDVPPGAVGNGHIYYLRLPDRDRRDRFIAEMGAAGVMAVFHYVPLHSSPHHLPAYSGPVLPHSQSWSDRLVRLPIYHSMTDAVQDRIIEAVHKTLL